MPRTIFVLAVIGLLGTSIQSSSTKHNNPYGIYKEVKVPWTVWTATAKPYREHHVGNNYEKPTYAPPTLKPDEPCEPDKDHQSTPQPPPHTPPTIHDDDISENININSNLNVNENALKDVIANANKQKETAQNDNQNPFLCELLFGKKTHICLH